MTRAELIRRAFDLFHDDAEAPPPLTLRGGDRVDSYETPHAYDEALDEPTDAYIERFAFHAMPFLDARSWRHYLPRLMDHAFRRPDEPTGLVASTLVSSLRPPDREPPRLTTLTAEQDAIITAFLHELANDPAHEYIHDDIQQALDEWWSADARLRPPPGELEAKRNAAIEYREAGSDNYRLTLPSSFRSDGVHHVVAESRRVEIWSGYLCGDAPARALVHFEAMGERTLGQVVTRISANLYTSYGARSVKLPGATMAHRLDGLMYGFSHSPAELERVIVLLAVVEHELLTMRLSSWEREDVEREMEHIVASFRLLRSA